MPARRFIDFDVPGGQLSVWCDGDFGSAKNAVLLVHDVASNARVWDPVMDRLPDGVPVLAPDLRGRGASSHLVGPHGVAVHAGDLLWVLDQADVSQVLAVGHGFGAVVVEAIANEEPDRVPASISINNADGSYVDPFVQSMAATFSYRGDHRQFWRSHPAFAEVPWSPAIEAFVDHAMLHVENAVRWRVDVGAVEEDLRDWSSQPSTVVPHSSSRRRVIDVGFGRNGGHVRLPWADMATVPLTAAGADAIACAVRPMISPAS